MVEMLVEQHQSDDCGQGRPSLRPPRCASAPVRCGATAQASGMPSHEPRECRKHRQTAGPEDPGIAALDVEPNPATARCAAILAEGRTPTNQLSPEVNSGQTKRSRLSSRAAQLEEARPGYGSCSVVARSESQKNTRPASAAGIKANQEASMPIRSRRRSSGRPRRARDDGGELSGSDAAENGDTPCHAEGHPLLGPWTAGNQARAMARLITIMSAMAKDEAMVDVPRWVMGPKIPSEWPIIIGPQELGDPKQAEHLHDGDQAHHR